MYNALYVRRDDSTFQIKKNQVIQTSIGVLILSECLLKYQFRGLVKKRINKVENRSIKDLSTSGLRMEVENEYVRMDACEGKEGKREEINILISHMDDIQYYKS